MFVEYRFVLAGVLARSVIEHNLFHFRLRCKYFNDVAGSMVSGSGDLRSYAMMEVNGKAKEITAVRSLVATYCLDLLYSGSDSRIFRWSSGSVDSPTASTTTCVNYRYNNMCGLQVQQYVWTTGTTIYLGQECSLAHEFLGI